MNAISPIFRADDQFSNADDACTWRGRYVAEFAMVEVTVSETLATLSTIASSGSKSLLPTAVGHRFEALRAVVSAGGPLAAVGGRVARALNDLREHRQRRNFLCHGSTDVSIDDLGTWRMTLSLIDFRGGKVERSAMVITEGEAAVLLEDLRAAHQRLDGQLRGLLGTFTK